MQKVLKFRPIYKEKVWGGRKLETVLGRNLPEGEIGESWEISDYGEDLSIIDAGPDSGRTFRTVYTSNTEEILGKPFVGRTFPLLIKLIDAKEKLSVQVHPNDEYADKFDPQSSGKKEAWTVLQADSNSKLVCGFSKLTNREEFETLISENRAEEILNVIPVKELDSFLLNPGKIHAIGSGILLMEVQQSSDSTYRVYDYGRPRELHLKKALDVLDYSGPDSGDKLSSQALTWKHGKRLLLTANDKFRMEILEIESPSEFILPSFSMEPVFHILMVLEGRCSIDGELELKKGDTVLITAAGIRAGVSARSLSSNLRLSWSGPGSDWISFQ
ncbi:putative phosphomannose isomerase type I [Leptospira inadai serovar Lyme str. 10]|uniref:Mannose-6-phosphate isomerase n=2 Tax=Leptospira inadai serovar Lyme TaxID=293084 RepID=A0ABX4YIZ9_9LEPT|nr:type I phosphomannose isomerase catalytic subunit [Leptospira inadai]EQA38078.1 putative phosphomannose isomerase type I [Leptospira inadai serovar Lyme str. 10]PNV75002.1 mannose-6-phosphate isomerase [Leptospira inadai serovar Lyme]